MFFWKKCQKCPRKLFSNLICGFLSKLRIMLVDLIFKGMVLLKQKGIQTGE